MDEPQAAPPPPEKSAEVSAPLPDALKSFKAFAGAALGYLATFLLLFFLLKAAVEGFQNTSYLRWILLAALLVAVGLSGWLLYKKRRIWEVFRVPALLAILLVVYSAILYPTSDPKALTLFGRTTEALLNPVFLIVLLFLIAALWLKSKGPTWLKIAVTVILAYCSLAFFYGMLRGVGLEDAFLGVDFFAFIPWFFLQPVYLTIHFVFPLVFVLLIFFWLKSRKSDPQRAKIFLSLGVLVLVTDVIGFVAMARNRVPNLFSSLLPSSPGVGEAITTIVDPGGRSVTVRLATKDFENARRKETAQFYSMALSYTKAEGDKRLFNLSIKDSAGKDVLFLGKDDFDFFENGQRQEPYDVLFELGGVKTGQNIILVLDHSGSMNKVIDQLKLAAKAFIDLKSRGDKILLIPFSSSPSAQPISTDKNTLKAQIDAIRSGGGTGLYQAVILGYDLGEKLSVPTTMVVMTDGVASDKNQERETQLAQKLASKKLRVYSVGLGKEKDVDEPFLKKLASEGGGKYYRTEDAGKLKDIYQTIGAELQSKYTAWYLHQVPAPWIALASPAKDSLVSGPTLFTGKVTNIAEIQLNKVEFFIDGMKVGEQQGGTGADYSLPLDPKTLALGKHQLKVVATGADGKTGMDEGTIEIQPAAELKIVRPGNGDTVTGATEIEATLLLRADKALSQLQFSVDGTPIGSAGQPPYVTPWNTDGLAPGEHTVKAQALFSDGTTVEDAIKVNISREMGLAWKNPAPNAELVGTVPLQVTFLNENPQDPVSAVQYFNGDTLLTTVTAAPFEYAWNTSGLAPGTYPLKAIAQTKAGKTVPASLRTQISLGQLVVDLVGSGETGEKAKFFFPPENVEIILDVSNSMWAQLPDGTKIDIAKQVLGGIVEQIPDQTRVAFRVYGGKSPVGKNDCQDSELLVPLSPLNRAALLEKIQGLVPRGKTPIAYSLKQVPADLGGGKGSSVVLLITDGLESCNGDPAAAAAELKQKGIQSKVHVVGYDVGDEKSKADLTKIAEAGGGKFFAAGTGVELKEAIIQAATADYRVLNDQGQEVLRSAVGNKVNALRPGSYQLVVDLNPPLTMPGLMIRPNQAAKILIQRGASGFQLIQGSTPSTEIQPSPPSPGPAPL